MVILINNFFNFLIFFLSIYFYCDFVCKETFKIVHANWKKKPEFHNFVVFTWKIQNHLQLLALSSFVKFSILPLNTWRECTQLESSTFVIPAVTSGRAHKTSKLGYNKEKGEEREGDKERRQREKERELRVSERSWVESGSEPSDASVVDGGRTGTHWGTTGVDVRCPLFAFYIYCTHTYICPGVYTF